MSASPAAIFQQLPPILPMLLDRGAHFRKMIRRRSQISRHFHYGATICRREASGNHAQMCRAIPA